MRTKASKVAAGYFKAHCLQLIDEVNHQHSEYIITKHGKPMAKLIPVQEGHQSLFGCLNNTVVIHSDIVSGTGEKWDVEE